LVVNFTEDNKEMLALLNVSIGRQLTGERGLTFCEAMHVKAMETIAESMTRGVV
jgi:hypothetical protein